MMKVHIEDHGTIVRLTFDAEGREWVDDNVETEGWQWFGGGLCVDHRMAGGFIDALIAEGFEVNTT